MTKLNSVSERGHSCFTVTLVQPHQRTHVMHLAHIPCATVVWYSFSTPGFVTRSLNLFCGTILKTYFEATV